LTAYNFVGTGVAKIVQIWLNIAIANILMVALSVGLPGTNDEFPS